MSFIRIANKAKDVNRLYLEKLGLSTKRDNESTIGQFGSGSKFAPIAALRNGWQWINVGEDNLGQYKMEYVIKEENGINSIYYLYNDEELKPSSFVAEAGILSWDNEFQIFREAFSNALDEFTEYGNEYSVTVVDDVEFVPGEFAVYVTADKRLLDIIQDFDKYFSIKRTPLLTSYGGSKIFKSFDHEANFYYKGVLVHSDSQGDISIFDYEFNSITLNEERRVRNTYELGSQVTAMFRKLRDDNDDDVEIAKTLIFAANKKRWEWNIPKYQIESQFGFGIQSNSAFLKAWKDIHGDAIAVTPELMRFKAQFAMRNESVVEIKSEFLYQILIRCGVHSAQDVLGDEIEYEFMTLTGRNRNMFEESMKIVKEFVADYDHYVNNTKFFIPQGEQDSILGIANMKEQNIYISINAFRNQETLIGTLIHEYDHLCSGYTDDDPAFRNEADNHIGRLLIELNYLKKKVEA
jgi:hypothetical protein